MSKLISAVSAAVILLSSVAFVQIADAKKMKKKTSHPTMNTKMTNPPASAGKPATMSNDTPTGGAPGGETATGGPAGGQKHN